MVNVYVCFGEWMVHERWEFVVDASRCGRMIKVEDDVGLAEFVKLVCGEYDLAEGPESIDVTYELPENVLQKMPKGTPPVYVKNDSQLRIFLDIIKSEVVRLCVSRQKDDDGNDDCDNDCENDEADYFDENDDDNDVGENDDENDVGENDGEDDDGENDDVENDDGEGYSVSEDEADNEWTTHEGMSKCTSIEVAGEGLHNSSTPRGIEVGDIFQSKAELINQLRILTIIQNFDYDVKKSTKSLFVAKCFVACCSWMIRCTSISETADDFIVRKMVNLHTCSVAVRYSRHRQATAKCIGRLYFEKFGRNGLLKGITPRHLRDTMKSVYSIDFGYTKAHSALKYARELLRGSAEEGYSDLPRYLHLIKKANPGSITRLECDGNDRFKYLFFAFSASIKGFEFLRKVVVVDGTHLHGKFKGTMLVATAQDGNSSIVPLAFAIVDTENDQSWEWFFVQLQAVVANVRGLVFVSDRHKSIKKAILKVFPAVPRGICIYHLGQNLKQRFPGTKAINLYKRAAKAARVEEFASLFEVIRRQDEKIAAYLERADIRTWSRAHFLGNRYNIMTSNICESINAALRDAREFPIAFFVDHVRAMLGRWFNERKEAAGLIQGLFTPKVEDLLSSRSESAGRLIVEPVDYNRSHVTGGKFECMVDLSQASCTCRMYDVEQIPCEHALAVARHRNISVINLVHPVYTKAYLYATYVESVNPLDASLPVPDDVAYQRCLPPLVKIPPGRPKKARYHSTLEKGFPKKKSKKEKVFPKKKSTKEEVFPKKKKQKLSTNESKRSYTCSQCNHNGHNRDTCNVFK